MADPQQQQQTTIIAGLVDAFGQGIQSQKDVLDEFISICKIYSIDPSELFYKYEAHLLSLPTSHPAHPSYTSTNGSGTGSGSSRGGKGMIDLEVARELRKVVLREQRMGKSGLNGSGVGGSGAGGGSMGGTPRVVGGVGVRKMGGDMGGFLDTLTTPYRPSTSTTTPRPLNPTQPTFTPTPTRPQTTTQTQNQAPYSSSSSALKSTPNSISGVGGYTTPSRPTAGLRGNGLLGTPMGGGGAGGMMASSPGSDLMTPRKTVPFAHRPQPSERLETLNPHLDVGMGIPMDHVGSKGRVKLSATRRIEDYDYRYMFEKISDRGAALDEIIEEYADTFRLHYSIHDLADPSVISESPVHVVGRIISLPTDTGKPNASSLEIESSRAMGSGKRTPLVFAHDLKVRGAVPGTGGFGVFPGVVVALKGRNGGGGAFVVSEVLMPHPGEMPTTLPSQMAHYQHTQMQGQPLSVMIAAGPYTLDTDLDYEPFDALMEVARNDRPDALILLGPFVDSSHPKIKNGDIDEMPADIFRHQIADRLIPFVERCPGTQVIMIPSVRDLISRHVAFPQSNFEKERMADLGLPKRVKFLPNPCSFFINEILFSMSTVDVLFHLRKEEYFRRAEEADPVGNSAPVAKDAMAELCRHVLGQRSFYPIFPPPLDLAGDVNLDVTHQELLRFETRAPDVLILPSRLKHFAKIVDSVVTINPSYIAKASTAGTFAKMTIHPRSRADLMNAVEKGDGEDEHQVYERARVDLIRI